ncbi:MAG: LysM peptidoglycan-binding domain-containing protein [Sedimenticola sp.]|nr:LysM peptidoglycan-binding domain-containing protein [Sedimenticola sp.]
MVRKLSLAMALVLGVSPLSSFAVGLGDIKLNSALNQYLDAEINLLSVDRDEISDIKVTLASPEAFRRSGIDRPFILSKLRFQADQTADGKTIVRVSSRDPIREPFLNFLIEVNWPKGKLLREYTVLLDPPVTLDRRPAPVQAAPMQKRRQQPASTSQSARSSRSAVAPSDVAWAGGAGPSEYGPTQRNDTLWGIAKQVRTEGASMQQMMIALQRANPQAFINQNINNLKVGQVLRIPKADEVMDLNRREAAKAYSDQLQEWQADSKPTEMVAEEQPASEEMAAGEPAEQAVAPQAELKIASARPSGEGEAGPSEGGDEGAVLEQLKQDLIVSEESKEAALQEVETVRSRVDDLESQLEDLQRLLSLKSEQLAKLQSGMGDAPGEAVSPEVIAEAVTEESSESPIMAESDTAEESDSPVMAESGDGEPDSMIKDLSLEQSEEAMEEAAAETESPVMAEEAAPATEETAEEAPAEEPAPVVAESEPEPAAQPASPAPAEEDNLLDMIAGDTTLLGVAVAGGVVLLALLWVGISRRRSNSADFQESILISTVDENDSEQVMDEMPQEPVSHPTEETSFLSDFSPSDIDALQDETGEVDPLAEADVYIAYGRYQQAEELIRQAIDKFPERPELKHKLFEILYATKDKDAFVALAESSAASGLDKKDEDAWNKVVTMGAQLAAGHALFAGATGVSADMDDDELASLEDELGLDNELGLDEVSTTVDLIDPDKTEELESIAALDLDDTSEFSELDDLSLDSGMDEISGDLNIGLDLPSDEAEEMLSFEDSDSLTVDADTDLSLVSPDSERVDEETSEFDMTLSHLDTDGLQDEDSSFSIEDPLETAELDDLRLDADSEAEQLGDAVIDFSDTAPMEGTDSQTFDSLELDQADDETPLELADSFSLDDLDEDDGTELKIGESDDDLIDENNTKLDLARAYVDMEDADGARNILEEVLSEGNEGQKQEAQALLDKLS